MATASMVSLQATAMAFPFSPSTSRHSHSPSLAFARMASPANSLKPSLFIPSDKVKSSSKSRPADIVLILSISSGSVRFSPLSIKAVSTEEKQSMVETTAPAEDFLADLQEKWDKLEDKSTVFIYGGGALATIWISSIVASAVNSVPLLPKVLELVGLGYTAWFVYKYLLFKENRKELVSDIEDLKSKIIGASSKEE